MRLVESVVLLALAPGAAVVRAEDAVAAVDRAVARAAEQAARAVVAVEVERDESAPQDPKEKPKAMPPVMPGARTRSILDYYSRPKGPVSGVAIEPDGFILTSYYNVAGPVKRITVTAGGTARPATLLGWSEHHDVALLKVDAKDLPVLPPAPAESLEPGRFCVHVGRSPLPARPTVTWGIVGAAHRWDDTAIQTDAEMSFGSAGGAVVDLGGRLIGIAAHIADRTVWGQSSGVGFATKLGVIREILPRLKAGEKIERQIGYLGVAFAEDQIEEGARIARVAPGTPADKAGLRANDLIVEFAEKPVLNVDLLIEDLRATKPGTKVKIKFRREQEIREVEVELINKPTPD